MLQDYYDFDGDSNSIYTPKRLRTGVLLINKEPLYIVELVIASSGVYDYVTVYEAMGKDLDTAQKSYQTKSVTYGYSTGTSLGKLANKIFKPQKKDKVETNRPLYMSSIEEGQDTFNKESYGYGFRDKTKVTTTIKGNEVVSSGGDNTGVFITLNSIHWQKKDTIMTDGMLEDIKARKTLLMPYE